MRWLSKQYFKKYTCIIYISLPLPLRSLHIYIYETVTFFFHGVEKESNKQGGGGGHKRLQKSTNYLDIENYAY